MNSEDKLIERLRVYAEATIDPDFRGAVATNDGLRIGPYMYKGICEQAASELSRRASRIEELEKALACVEVRAEGVVIRVPSVGVHGWVLLRDSEIAPVVSAAFNKIQQAALSAHPDKEGGK